MIANNPAQNINIIPTKSILKQSYQTVVAGNANPLTMGTVEMDQQAAVGMDQTMSVGNMMITDHKFLYATMQDHSPTKHS